MKECTSCSEVKALSDFSKDRRNKSGYTSWCKACFNEYSKKYGQKRKPRSGRYSRIKHLEYKYGISLKQYHELEEKQNKLCAICDSEEKLVIDHNHKTKEIRGLICNSCNIALGKFKDSAHILEKAKNYLENSKTGWFTPEKEDI